MIAMQYSFTLPADYDMGIVRRRIAEKGHLLDDFPGLAFKAYLYANRDDASANDNLYAPFYLWHDSDGMNEFLAGPGFEGVTQSFGRPSVRTWSVWQAQLTTDLSCAASATCEVIALPPHGKVDACRQREALIVSSVMAAGALAAVSAFEPTTWTLLRVRLWSVVQKECASDGRQLYHVGHISQPGRGH